MRFLKVILPIFILIVGFTNLSAQQHKTAFNKGQIDANFGIGLNMTTMVNGMKAYVPPVNASIDYAFSKKLSIGLVFGIAAVENYVPEFKKRRALASDDPSLAAPSKDQMMVIGTRFGAHYNQLEKVDFYGGPIVGVRYILTTPIDEATGIRSILENENTERKMAYGAFIGARYHVLPNVGIFGEIGSMNGAFQVGLNFRM